MLHPNIKGTKIIKDFPFLSNKNLALSQNFGDDSFTHKLNGRVVRKKKDMSNRIRNDKSTCSMPEDQR